MKRYTIYHNDIEINSRDLNNIFEGCADFADDGRCIDPRVIKTYTNAHEAFRAFLRLHMDDTDISTYRGQYLTVEESWLSAEDVNEDDVIESCETLLTSSMRVPVVDDDDSDLLIDVASSVSDAMRAYISWQICPDRYSDMDLEDQIRDFFARLTDKIASGDAPITQAYMHGLPIAHSRFLFSGGECPNAYADGFIIRLGRTWHYAQKNDDGYAFISADQLDSSDPLASALREVNQ